VTANGVTIDCRFVTIYGSVAPELVDLGFFDNLEWMNLHNSYSRINNEVYNTESDSWWQPDSALYLLKNCINPARINYAKKVLANILKTDPLAKSALEVGCGGGILCEEIAGMKFDTTGIDPSEQSLRIAIRHAESSRLCIKYEVGTGEAIPYSDASYDVVFCCDVLEHVRDLPRVIS
jgi:2-polyprenyl-6-hydroxyphenyl methylase/3-demethylubiquinone-9 3-methyltransferase